MKNGPKYQEPLFISSKYGLIGRFDMLYLNKEKKEASIYELKSGKAPKEGYSAWENHRYQLECYSYLLSENKNIDSVEKYLVYSQAKRPLFPIQEGYDKNIIFLRNLIIGLHLNIREPNKFQAPKYLYHNEDTQCKACMSFAAKNCKSDKKFFRELNGELLKKYYDYFFSRLEWEKWENIKKLSKMWKSNIEHRVNTFVACKDLKIKQIENKKIVFKTDDIIESDFRIGDNLYFYTDNPIGNELFRGIVTNISFNEIEIESNKELYLENNDASFILERDYPTSGSESQQISLDRFVRTYQKKIDLILYKEKPSLAKREKINPDIINRLNSEQIEAFHKSISANDYLLVQGPPGTGKSFVITELILDLVERGNKIIVSAYTNKAIDNILLRLMRRNFFSFLRIGSFYNMNQDIKENSMQTLINHYYKNNFTDNDLISFKNKLMQIPVIAVTTTSAMSTLLFDNNYYDYVILDEVSQMTEPSALAVVQNAKKFILFGDSKQLPPVVQSNEDNEIDEELKKININGLSTSLFERLWDLNKENNNDLCLCTLKKQYRMNEDIMYLANNLYYDNELIADESCKNLKLKDLDYLKLNLDDINTSIANLVNPDNSVSILDIDSDNTEYGSIKENITEAKITCEIVKHLINAGISLEDIGVITPFKAQCAKILKLLNGFLNKEELSEIMVDTVERFQGSEKLVIIFSFTLSDKDFLSLLSQNEKNLKRKLNVAITRAERKLIILGNFSVLNHINSIHNIYELAKSKNWLYKY